MLAVGDKVRLRLESIGGSHRVYLNDRQVLTARDFTMARETCRYPHQSRRC